MNNLGIMVWITVLTVVEGSKAMDESHGRNRDKCGVDFEALYSMLEKTYKVRLGSNHDIKPHLRRVYEKNKVLRSLDYG
jgi:hypothetical protein